MALQSWSLLGFGLGLCSTETVEVLYLEGLDVCALTKYIFLSHANVYVGTLLEELRSLGGVAQDEK